MVSLTKQKAKHPKNWADAPVFVPVSDKLKELHHNILSRFYEGNFSLKAHVHPSSFVRLFFCFGTVNLLNAVV